MATAYDGLEKLSAMALLHGQRPSSTQLAENSRRKTLPDPKTGDMIVASKDASVGTAGYIVIHERIHILNAVIKIRYPHLECPALDTSRPVRRKSCIRLLRRARSPNRAKMHIHIRHSP